MSDDFMERAEAAAKRVAAAAWAEGFVASFNMDRGRGLDGMGEPVDRFLWDDIEAWNPYTGTGTVDPNAEEE